MIFEVLHVGIENAQTSKALCNLLGIDSRTLRAAIERERRNGKPICASCSNAAGYYIPTSKEEMQSYCERLEHREMEIAKTRRACYHAAEKMIAQGVYDV